MEEVKKMSVRDRRYYIQKHNAEQGEIRKAKENRNGSHTYTNGEGINNFAANEQSNEKNRGRR